MLASAIVPLIVAVQPASAASIVAALERSVALFSLSPPSPDPAGIAYLPAKNRLLVGDSEVDETTGAGYHGTNLWEMTQSGTVTNTGTTLSYTNEPTGLSFDPATSRLFVSDDVLHRVFVVSIGIDGVAGTADDSIVASFDTAAYGNTDPEDVAFDTDTGHVFVSDGIGTEVYEVSPGNNGVFDGVPPAGDDATSHFDVGRFGAEDSEGLAYDGTRDTLLVLDRNTNTIYETNKLGMLVNTIDLSAATPDHPADIVLAPGSSNPGRTNLYFVTRGVDNDGHPTENDGMLYEMSVDLPPIGNLTPMVSAGQNQVVTLPGQATLTGSVVDDGLPGGTLTTTWSQVSGPTSATIADPSSQTTSVSFSQAGTYVFSLTGDDSALLGTDDVTVFVAASDTTILQRPVVASADDAEEAATGGVNLNSTDLELVLDGSRGNQIVGMRFTGVTVPKGATVSSAYIQFQADRATSTATALTIQGQAADNAGSFTKASTNISSRPRTAHSVAWNPPGWPTPGAAGPAQQTPNIASVVQEIVSRPNWSSGNAMAIIITGSGKRAAESFNGNAPPVLRVEYYSGTQNQAPIVNAGVDQQVTLPNTTTMAGAASDDGLPNPPGAITTTWSLVDGPQSVLFGDPSSPTTAVTFEETGTYTLRLTADDGMLRSTDDVTVTVDPLPGTNRAPVTNAGPDQQVTLPSTATMAASATDDGLPNGTLTTTWSQVSGPGIATFADPSSLTTTVGFSDAGSYVLRLTGDDGALQSSDDVMITANPASGNLVGNPGFEVDTSGWNTGASIAGVTLTRVTGGHGGSSAAKLTNGSTSSGTCMLNDSPNWANPTVSGTYSASLWARADSAGATLRLRFREYSGTGTLIGTPTVSQLQLTTAWQLISVTHTPQAAGTTLDLTAYISSAPPGTCFYADDVTITPP